MKAGYCFGCDKNRIVTDDHIIPQAIGGKKKAPLCESCHRKVHSVDTEVANSLFQIATILNVKRERGKHQPIRVKQVNTGNEFEMDAQMAWRAKPRVKINFDQQGHPILDIKARSEKELKKIISNIQKKYGEIVQPLEFTCIKNANPLGLVEYENEIGGREFMRSVAKSAFLFLATQLPKEKVSSEIFNPIRNFIFDDIGKSLVSFNYIHTKFLDDRYRPLHSIVIHFDSHNRNIISYIQYFDIFRFSILVAQNFSWVIAIPDIKYCINPVDGYEFQNPVANLQDITIDECLSPIQSVKLVYDEIETGFHQLDFLCKDIYQTAVELSDDKSV